MKREFDWDKFKTENIAVHCKTEEEAKDFCREMHGQRMKWKSCDSYVENTNYDVYPGKMCYYANGEYSSLKFAEEHSLTILEWSDYMQKEFTKADLKDGMVVEEQRGIMGFVLSDRILYEDGWNSLSSWKEDLRSRSNIRNGFDIVKIYKIRIENVYKLSDILDIENLELIWERTEAKHMTAEEMRQKLEELTGEKIEAKPSREEMIGVCYKYCSDSANGNCGKDCALYGSGDCCFEDYLLRELKQCYEKVIVNGR